MAMKHVAGCQRERHHITCDHDDGASGEARVINDCGRHHRSKSPQFCWLPLQDLRSTAFRYLLQHGVPGPTWGDREFLPTARRPGRTRQGGASPQLLEVPSSGPLPASSPGSKRVGGFAFVIFHHPKSTQNLTEPILPLPAVHKCRSSRPMPRHSQSKSSLQSRRWRPPDSARTRRSRWTGASSARSSRGAAPAPWPSPPTSTRTSTGRASRSRTRWSSGACSSAPADHAVPRCR